jgi:hypothetical protein
MEPLPDLKTLSSPNLRVKLKEYEKLESAWLAAIPDLETPPPSLSARYGGGGAWGDLVELRWRIREIKLELISRGQALRPRARRPKARTHTGFTELTVEVSKLENAPTNAATSAESEPADPRALVDRYINDVLRQRGKRITRTDFWKAAGYKNATEFQRWQRQDPKHRNKAADGNFKRILLEKPHLK